MPYSDDYTLSNAPDLKRDFMNSNGDAVSENTTDDMITLVEGALTAADTMLASAWKLIDNHKLDCARDILAGPSDEVGEWVHCATGHDYADLDEDFGIDVWRMERGYPAIMRTRELFKRS